MSIPPSSPSPPPAANKPPMIWVGLALAVLAVVLVNAYAALLVKKSQEDTFTVYQFSTDLNAGRPLTKDSVKAIQEPKKFENSFGKIVRESDYPALIADAPKLRIDASAGQLLTYDFVPEPGKDVPLKPDPIKTRGDVSVAIKVENLPAALSPGDFVDVQVQVPAGRGRPGMKVMGLMENVRVIAKGEVMRADARTPGNASKIDIELTPEQALQVKNIQLNLGGAAFEVTVRKRQDNLPHGTVPDMTQVNPEVFKALGISAYRIEN